MLTEHRTRQRLLLLIRESHGVTLGQLSRLTGVSRTVVSRHVAALKRAGLVNSEVVRRSVGRPSYVYRLTPAVRYGRYSGLLHMMHARLRRQSRADVEDSYNEIAHQIAVLHPEIRLLPNALQRLEAARRVVFGDMDSTPALAVDGRCEFSHHTCPLAPVALEFGDPCRLARAVLSALVGGDVAQSEWIIRGDPRCTFELQGTPDPS